MRQESTHCGFHEEKIKNWFPIQKTPTTPHSIICFTTFTKIHSRISKNLNQKTSI